MILRCIALTCLLMIGIGSTKAQTPSLSSVFPAGGKSGTTVDLKLSGKNLKNVGQLFFSHPGIKSRSIKSNMVQIDITSDVPDGEYDVWVLTESGLTNPRRFVVGSRAEISEKESNNDLSTAQKVTMPVTINGTLNPGTDRDFYRFHVKAGDAIHLRFRSLSIDGTARAAFTLYGPNGEELLHDDGRSGESSLAFQASKSGSYILGIEERGFQTGANNVYRLSIFSGPRLVAAFPHILPRGKSQPVTLYGYNLPGGILVDQQPVNSRVKSSVRVLPLQKLQVRIECPDAGDSDGGGWLSSHASMIDGFIYRHPNIPGAIRFGLIDGPVELETDALHGSKEKAQRVPFPCTIAGRFLTPGEVDWYRMSVKKGQTLWLETVGERGGRQMDLELAVHDGGGKILQEASDFAVKKSTIPVNTLDAMCAWKVPADGEYYIVVRDLYGNARFGVDRNYRLHVGKRTEKVTVTALPMGKTAAGFAVPRGGTAKLQISTVRYNGHQDPIRIRAEKLPSGLQAEAVTIPAKKNDATMIFTAAKNAKSRIDRLQLVAETTVNGKKTTFPVVAMSPVNAGSPEIRRCQGLVAAICENPPAKKTKK